MSGGGIFVRNILVIQPGTRDTDEARRLEDSPIVFVFEHEPIDANLDDKAREIVRAFLATDAGRDVVEANLRIGDDAFTWNDAIHEIPDAFWAKHGLTVIAKDAAEVTVNIDENLLPESSK